jgi:hypothetical protein
MRAPCRGHPNFSAAVAGPGDLDREGARSDRIEVAGKARPRPGRDGTRFNMTGNCTGSRIVALAEARYSGFQSERSEKRVKPERGNRHCYQFLPST